MKICHIVGARPQFMKYQPMARAQAAQDRAIDNILIHSGQHYDYNMSKIFFDQLGIQIPDYHLEAGGQNQAGQTAAILSRTDEILEKENPDALVVYGDTNTTLGGALAAVKRHIPVVHVEAGLRSFNKFMPEEINRIMTDCASTLLFCPSPAATAQLEKEGVGRAWLDGRVPDMEIDTITGPVDKNHPLIVNAGDVMYDSLLLARQVAEKESCILNELNLGEHSFSLLTLHRAENTDDSDRFQSLVDFINERAREEPILFPMHPRTRKVYESHPARFSDGVRIIPPVSYFDLLTLMDASSRVLTDSGGMQKEAYWMKTPCVTLRKETEWVETVTGGWNILYENFAGGFPEHRAETDAYGDGKAADKMVAILVRALDR